MKNIFINVNFLEPRQLDPVLSLSERFVLDKDNIKEPIQDKLNDLFLNNDGVNIINILHSIYTFNNFHFSSSFKNENNQLVINIDIIDEYNKSKLENIKYKYNKLFDHLREFIDNLMLVRYFTVKVKDKIVYEYENRYLSCKYDIIDSHSKTWVNMCCFSLSRIINPSILDKE